MYLVERLFGAGLRWLAAFLLVSVSSAASAGYAVNFQKPVTEIARDQYDLHMLIFWISVGIFIGVFGFMFYSIFKHRKSKGHQAATFHESTTVEVLWTIIPLAILVAMAIPSTATLLKMEKTGDADMTVKITGYQWKWQYEYPDAGIRYFSALSTPREQITEGAEKGENYLLEVDNPMVLPVGKKVRFLVTAADVIHAWWVPQLGIKRDAIPGFINEMWTRIDEPGTYRGQCAELCGKDHGFMPIVVKAVNAADYAKWIAGRQQEMAASTVAAGKTWSLADLVARGEKIYGTNCAACHGATGKGIPGVFPPIAGSPVATGPVDAHLDVAMNGKPGTAMQAFAKQLDDLDLAAVVTFQRNSFGNATGDVIQPVAVEALRK